MLRAQESENVSPKQEVQSPCCHERAKVRPKLYTIFAPGPECLPPEGVQLSPPGLPQEQHNVHWRKTPAAIKGRPRRSTISEKVPVAIEESLLSTVIAFPEPESLYPLHD